MRHYTIKLFVVICISYSAAYKSAIKYFTQNKTIKYSNIKVINNNNTTSTKFWIEYNYYFENANIKINKSNLPTLKIAVFSPNSNLSNFNHDITKNISNMAKDHIADLIQLLLDYYNIRYVTQTRRKKRSCIFYLIS